MMLVIGHLTGLGTRFTGYHIHQRGFTRTIRANNATQLANAYLQ